MVEFRDVIKRYAAEGEAVGVEDGEVDGLPVVQAIVAGANVTVDDTDPARPVISATGGGGGGGGAVDSVNGKTGAVVLDYNDVGAASAAQGQLADTAVQPEALAAVATSGDYTDLTGTPTLGTAAAADTEDFATAEQGEKADAALPRNESYDSPPALAALSDVNLDYELGVDAPDVRRVRRGSTIMSWLNEWGALRGVSPFAWGDALVRAIRRNGDGINQGQFVELEDRRSGAAASVMYGRRWVDGRLVRNDTVMADVWTAPAGTPVPAGLPDGTVVVFYEEN